jgi:hypothetical protein
MATFDVSKVICVLPNRQPRTRGPPCIKDLGIRARRTAQPFEEIEDESLDGVRHHGRRKLVHPDIMTHFL